MYSGLTCPTVVEVHVESTYYMGKCALYGLSEPDIAFRLDVQDSYCLGFGVGWIQLSGVNLDQVHKGSFKVSSLNPTRV